MTDFPQIFPVLVIDDDPNIFEIMSRAAQKHFPEALFIRCRNAGEAVAYFHKPDNIRPRLILLDLFLEVAESDGFVLLPELKKQLAEFQIPVVVLSGYAKESSVLQAYELGASSFIEKPADFHGWVGMMDNLLEYWKGNSIPEIKPPDEQTPSVVPETPPYP